MGSSKLRFLSRKDTIGLMLLIVVARYADSTDHEHQFLALVERRITLTLNYRINYCANKFSYCDCSKRINCAAETSIGSLEEVDRCQLRCRSNPAIRARLDCL